VSDYVFFLNFWYFFRIIKKSIFEREFPGLQKVLISNFACKEHVAGGQCNLIFLNYFFCIEASSHAFPAYFCDK